MFNVFIKHSDHHTTTWERTLRKKIKQQAKSGQKNYENQQLLPDFLLFIWVMEGPTYFLSTCQRHIQTHRFPPLHMCNDKKDLILEYQCGSASTDSRRACKPKFLIFIQPTGSSCSDRDHSSLSSTLQNK